MKNTISIIIPVYNSQNHLSACIDSILKENTKSKFEVILIDDGSTDDSLKICNRYAAENENVKVIHRSNSGVSATRNCGLTVAKGNWVWFVDSDDILYPGAINILHLKISKQDTDIIIFNHKKFNNNPKFSKLEKISFYPICKTEAIKTMLDKNYACFPWNKLFRKKVITDNQITFPEDMIMCEDMEFCYKVFDKAHNFLLTDDVLYGYRCDGSGASFSIENRKYKDAAIAACDFYNYIQKAYPQGASQAFREAITATIAYLHRYNCNDEKYSILSGFVKRHRIQYKELSIRYRIELLSFVFCKPIFSIIGLIGKINRR